MGINAAHSPDPRHQLFAQHDQRQEAERLADPWRSHCYLYPSALLVCIQLDLWARPDHGCPLLQSRSPLTQSTFLSSPFAL